MVSYVFQKECQLEPCLQSNILQRDGHLVRVGAESKALTLALEPSLLLLGLRHRLHLVLH